MTNPIQEKARPGVSMRFVAAAGVVLLAVLAVYRAWVDMAVIGVEDPEQSQVLLALPAVALLLALRRDSFAKVPLRSSLLGVATAAAGWALSWYGYMNAVQSFWHLGAVLMVIGAAWSVFGNRAILVALPAVIAMAALVPVPNLIRLDIALPLQRITAISSEFLLISLGLDVERVAQTLHYKGKPARVDEACNGMRMIFSLALVCYAFVMAYRLNPFARIMLLGISPVIAIACNIIRVVPTVIIYGEYGDHAGDMFHDLSGWFMIVLAPLVLFGMIRVLTWAEVPIYADPVPPSQRQALPNRSPRKPMPWLAAPALCALLMCGATAHSLTLPKAADAQPYHAAVVEAADKTPILADNLKPLPQEIPDGSLELLRPNVSRAVKYTDAQTGVTGQFLLIQSKDARDLSGHYPPRCYPNVYGYTEVDRQTRQWQIDDLTIHGIEYTFAESDEPDAPRWVVMHYFALPGGGTTGKLLEMRAAAADYLRRHHGAAQVQLLFSEAAATTEQRDEMFVRVMRSQTPLLRAILAGPENFEQTP